MRLNKQYKRQSRTKTDETFIDQLIFQVDKKVLRKKQ